MNSGYVTLDGGGINLASSDEQSISGSWARVQAAVATGKPIIAFNTKYGTAPLTPVPVFGWAISSTRYVLVGATLHIEVTSTDKCYVIDVAPTEAVKSTETKSKK